MAGSLAFDLTINANAHFLVGLFEHYKPRCFGIINRLDEPSKPNVLDVVTKLH